MFKPTFKRLFLFFSIIAVFSACVNEKKLIYFKKTNNHSDTLSVAKAYVPRIEPGDILSIEIGSLNDQASSFFNQASGGAAGAAGGSGITDNNIASSPALGKAASPGYLVDPSGTVELQFLGSIKVSGYTTSELRDTLKSRLRTYLKKPTVIVRFLNFKISIMGEVNKPQVYNIPNEMITLPEALTIAGDLTLYARRDSIQIIRDVNGKKVVGWVNLNTREVFSSPYYYLHSNDLVYVMPSKIKVDQTDKSLQYVSVGVSIISILLIIFRK